MGRGLGRSRGAGPILWAASHYTAQAGWFLGPLFELGEPFVDRGLAEPDVAAHADVRDLPGADLGVDPVAAHAGQFGDVVDGEQPRAGHSLCPRLVGSDFAPAERARAVFISALERRSPPQSGHFSMTPVRLFTTTP